jgi:hypothetical protein
VSRELPRDDELCRCGCRRDQHDGPYGDGPCRDGCGEDNCEVFMPAPREPGTSQTPAAEVATGEDCRGFCEEGVEQDRDAWRDAGRVVVLLFDPRAPAATPALVHQVAKAAKAANTSLRAERDDALRALRDAESILDSLSRFPAEHAKYRRGERHLCLSCGKAEPFNGCAALCPECLLPREPAEAAALYECPSCGVAMRKRADRAWDMHASVPAGMRCADCSMDGEPCPDCYAAAWRKRHPNVIFVNALAASRIPPPQPEATPPQRDGDDRSAALAKSSASSPAPAAEVDLTEALRDEIEKYLRWMEPEWYATVPQLRGAIRKVLAERDADLREMAQWALPLCYCQGEAVCPAHRALAKKEPTP